MSEHDLPKLPTAPEYPQSVRDALEILRDAEEHVAAQLAMGGDDEEDRHGRFYAEDGLAKAREALAEAIVGEAVSRTMTYDEAIALLGEHGFDCPAATEADYSEVLARFVDGQQILLKHGFYYPQDVVGTIGNDAFLAPYTDSTSDNVRPVVIVTVTNGDIAEPELIFVRKRTQSEDYTTPGVIIGSDAIESRARDSSDYY